MTVIETICIGGISLLLGAGAIGMVSGAKDMASAHSEMTHAMTQPANRMDAINAMAQAERERRRELAKQQVAE